MSYPSFTRIQFKVEIPVLGFAGMIFPVLKNTGQSPYFAIRNQHEKHRRYLE